MTRRFFPTLGNHDWDALEKCPETASVPYFDYFDLPNLLSGATQAEVFAVVKARVDMLTTGIRTPVGVKVFGTDLKEGFLWLWRHPLLRRLAVILGILNALGSGTLAVFVLFGQEILGLGASEFGLLLTAGAAGGVVGSLVASGFSEKLGSGATLQFTLITGALTSIGIGLTSSAVLVWIMFAVTSLGAVMWNVVTVSLRQRIVPDRLGTGPEDQTLACGDLHMLVQLGGRERTRAELSPGPTKSPLMSSRFIPSA